MSENENDLEKEQPEGAPCGDTCDCGKPGKPEQEYADAVDESAEGEAEAAVDELQTAYVDGDNEAMAQLCRKTSALLAERNRLCKLNKN